MHRQRRLFSWSWSDSEAGNAGKIARTMAALETIGVNCECGAHHEAGHIVIAAVEGLRLKPEGLMVDPSGWGAGLLPRGAGGPG